MLQRDACLTRDKAMIDQLEAGGGWMVDHAFLVAPSQAIVGQRLAIFEESPIRQKPASFDLDDVMQKTTPKQ